MILLALVAGIDEVDKIIERDNSMYWKMLRQRMESLQTYIKDYKWEVEG